MKIEHIDIEVVEIENDLTNMIFDNFVDTKKSLIFIRKIIQSF